MESLSPGKGIAAASSDVSVRDTVDNPTQINQSENQSENEEKAKSKLQLHKA